MGKLTQQVASQFVFFTQLLLWQSRKEESDRQMRHTKRNLIGKCEGREFTWKITA
jgi:hypothetical protein